MRLSLFFQAHQLKSKIRSLAPSIIDDKKIETVPPPPTQKPASKPAKSSGDVEIKTVPAQEQPDSKPIISSGQGSAAAATATAPKPLYNRAKTKKIVSRDGNSNFFGTPSLSPSPSLPAANSTPRGKPPVLTQDAYRSSFKRARPAFGNVTNDESWPPKRRKKMAKDNDVNADVEMTDAFGRVETNKTVSALPADGSANGQIRLRPPAQVNAVASSSNVLLSDLPHQPAKPTNLLKVICAKGTPSSDIHTDAPCPSKPIQGTNSNVVKKKHDSSVADSSSRNTVPVKPINRLISSPNDDVNLQLARLSVEVDDPFIANKHTTTTSPIGNFILHPRRIDLRQSFNATRRSSRSSTTTRSSTPRRSNPFVLPEDREIFSMVGLRKVMAVIAKNYGFDVDVAIKAFYATKSIEKTKSLLQFAKEVTNSATSALLSELVSDDDMDSSDDEDAPHQSMWRGHNNNSSSPNEKDRHQRSALNSGRQKTKRSLGGSRKSKRLSIKPRPLDEEIDEMAAFSDYLPPRVTRAGQFLRLVKEGRREEAVDRERRRASGVFVAQTQTQAQRYDDQDPQSQQLSLSLVPNSSPTLKSPGQVPAVDTFDDFKHPSQAIVAPHEDNVVQQHYDQSPDEKNILLPVDNDDEHHQNHQGIFIKRISEGQSSLNEDEDDPEVLKLAQEHRDLVMNVMEENADALRSFEQRNNQDLLRIWSLDWARQKIADM